MQTMNEVPFLAGGNRQARDAQPARKRPGAAERPPETPPEGAGNGPKTAPKPAETDPTPPPDVASVYDSDAVRAARERVEGLVGRLRATTARRLEVVGLLASPARQAVNVEEAARRLLETGEMPAAETKDDREALRLEVARLEHEESILSRAAALAQDEAKAERRREESRASSVLYPWCRGEAKRLAGVLRELLAIERRVEAAASRLNEAGIPRHHLALGGLDLRKPAEGLLNELRSTGLLGEAEMPAPLPTAIEIRERPAHPPAPARPSGPADAGALAEDQDDE